MKFYKRAAFMVAMVVLSPCQSIASEQAVVFSDVNDVVRGWQAEQNLYVRGNLGVSKKALAELEVWLDKKAQNWTVVLLQNANGQSWKDTRKLSYYGIDAVENALGRGLSNDGDFHALQDVDDQKRNGAIFVLFLEERKLAYFADEAYDDRFLGENAWIGNLDHKAIQAMRGGSGVVNAVKDTVQLIEKKLQHAKRREAEGHQRKIINKKETESWVQREAEKMEASLEDMAAKAGEIRAVAGAEDGDIANPPLNDWRQVIRESTGNPDPYLAKKALLETAREMKQQRDDVTAWYSFPERAKTLGNSLAKLQIDEGFNGGSARVSDLKGTIKLAREMHFKGDQSHHGMLVEAENELEYIIEKNEVLKAERLRKEEQDSLYHAQIAAAELRRKETVKKTAIAGGGAGSLALLGLGVFSNRRRKKRKLLAEQLYAEWKEAMSERVDKLFTVMDRASIVVGSERDLPERGYKGETLKRSLSAIKKVDKSFVLTASVDKAMGMAKELIYPSNLSSRSVNVFSRARYDDALELLEKKPLGSHLPVEAIKVADRGEEKMLGSRENAENVELSFTELIAEFDQNVEAAESDLDVVEGSWETIAARTDSLGDELAEIADKDKELEALALDDNLFQLDGLFEEWLPIAGEHHVEGIEMGKYDPVAALSQKVEHGERMVQEMQRMIQSVEEFRSTELEAVEEGAQILHELHRSNEWIRERMLGYDETLNSISQRGINASVEEEIMLYKGEMFELQSEVDQACKLAKMTLATLTKLIDDSKEKADSARSEIAENLKLSKEEILVERDDWNPDELLAEAERLRVSTQQCLDEGLINQAQHLADQSVKNIKHSDAMVEASVQANANYAKEFAEVNDLLNEATELKDAGVLIMVELTSKYNRSALQVDPENKETGSFVEVEEAMQGAYSQLNKDKVTANDYQQKGWVLHADQCLNDAKNAHEHVRGLHAFITTRKVELEGLEQRNKLTLTTYDRELVRLSEVMDDSRVTRATLGYFNELEQAFELVNREVNSKHGESNPFAAEASLEELKERILAIETRIQSDKEAHAATQSAIMQLSQLYDKGMILVQKAQRDGIVDSEKTEDSVTNIQRSRDLIEAHKESIEEAHNNWSHLYDEAQSSYVFLSEAVLVLKQELAHAATALSNIRAAARIVSGAMHWSGSYGVRISSHHGSDELNNAQRALDTGDYVSANNYAAAAQREARSAISNAESKVASIRHQRAEAERARRKARSRARQSSMRTSSSARSSIGSSSISKSSSRSRGSSGSNGSGFSRSGW